MENRQANVRNVNGSVVSIGNAGAITNQVGAEPPGDRAGTLEEVLSRLAALLPELTLPPETRAELEAEIRTVEAQVGSPRPKKAIIHESMRTIRAVLEGAAGNAAYVQLLALIDRFLAG
jgi:hypothetical protein